MLNQYLQDKVGDNDSEKALQIDLKIDNMMPKYNLKRKHEMFDEIVVQRAP